MHLPTSPIDHDAWVLEIPEIHLVSAPRVRLMQKYGVHLRSDYSILLRGTDGRFYSTARKYADVAAATGHLCGCENCFSCAVLALYRAHSKKAPIPDEEEP
jgi:hypothetical protein